MICFDVFVNGKRLCRAGVGAAGVLTAIVDWVGSAPQSPRLRGRTVEGGLLLHVGGLYSPDDNTDIHPRWATQQLMPGDEVVVKIVKAERADEPVEKQVNTREFIEQEQRKYYLAMKKKFEPASSPSQSRRSSARSGGSGEVVTKRAPASRQATEARKASRKKKR
jgi:hypothetical protein